MTDRVQNAVALAYVIGFAVLYVAAMAYYK